MTASKSVLIWSVEHNAWWAPNCNGYVWWRSLAGRYSIAEANEICIGANARRDDRFPPNEVMVPIGPDEKEKP